MRTKRFPVIANPKAPMQLSIGRNIMKEEEELVVVVEEE